MEPRKFALSDILFWDNFRCPVCGLFWLNEPFNHCRETYLIFAADSLEFQT
jgi:hypothetical protein